MGIKLEGFAELRKTLDLLEGRLRGRVIRKAQRKALQPTVKEIKARAPKGLTGETRKSIGLVNTYMTDTTSDVVITNRRGKKYPHSHVAMFHEFGTVYLAAKPFMEPTFRSDIGRILDRFGNSLREEIDKVL
jgi:HK97 gp10 family phage protein